MESESFQRYKSRIYNIQKELEDENKELAKLYEGENQNDSVYIEMKKKLEEINIENILDSYSEFTSYVSCIDTYQMKRLVVNSHMKEMWENLKGDYSTLKKASEFVQRMLKYYNFSYRDSDLHDYVWTKHDSSSKLFNLDTIEKNIVFCNSTNTDSNNVFEFVDNLATSIRKYLPTNIKLSWKVKEDEKRCMKWVLIILNCDMEVLD